MKKSNVSFFSFQEKSTITGNEIQNNISFHRSLQSSILFESNCSINKGYVTAEFIDNFNNLIVDRMGKFEGHSLYVAELNLKNGIIKKY